MNKPHKHAELIKAWADGAEIEVLSYYTDEWVYCDKPNWDERCKWRIKPASKPDVVKYATTFMTSWHKDKPDTTDNLKLTFDGETGELKSAEVLK